MLDSLNVTTWPEATKLWEERWSGHAIIEQAHVQLPPELLEPTAKALTESTQLFPGTRGLKLWKHEQGGERTPEAMHYICVLGCTGVHTDPDYCRYAHHLKVRVDPGMTVRGLYDRLMLRRGLYYVLDAHEPHEVRGPSTNTGWNFGVCFDSERVWPIGEILPKMIEFAYSTPLT